MRCPTDHGSLIRVLANALEFSWNNIHGVRDGEDQADRVYWCVRELSIREESRLAHVTTYHWEELLTALPQYMRHGYREFADQVLWSPKWALKFPCRAPWFVR